MFVVDSKQTYNRENMSLKKYLPYFSLLIAMLFFSNAYGQVGDSVLVEKGNLTPQFTMVKLDGKVVYRNESSNDFLTPTEYFLRYQPSYKEASEAGQLSGFEDFYYYWDSEKVNPYVDVELPTPFKIEFDQSTFTHPIDGYIKITSRFGRRRRGPHRGLDIDLVTGDQVRSVLPGKVRFVGYSSGHGKTVVVRHANGVETVYAHLSAYKVKPNDVITEGQVIGLGGNTGNSRGSHLHLEVRYKGVCIHPEYVFNFDGSQTIRGTELWVNKTWKSPRSHSSYRPSECTPLHSLEAAIAAEKAAPRFHRVRRGDTLSHIAERYHLRTSEICRLNGISKTTTLRIGQTLRIR